MVIVEVTVADVEIPVFDGGWGTVGGETLIDAGIVDDGGRRFGVGKVAVDPVIVDVYKVDESDEITIETTTETVPITSDMRVGLRFEEVTVPEVRLIIKDGSVSVKVFLQGKEQLPEY
jgi:hypothetical protein